MRKLYFTLLLAVALVGCGDIFNQEEFTSTINRSYSDLVASIDDSSTRVYIEDDLSLAWHEGDRISVFYANDFNNVFAFNGDSGDKSGSFSLVGNGGVGYTSLDRIYAIYPYQTTATISAAGTISLLMPSKQSYAERSFPRDGNIMVAATSSEDDVILAFRNAVGYLKLKLWGDGTVKSIKVEGNANEKIAGAAELIATTGGAPTLQMSADATTSITLDCGTGVELSGSKSAPTEFWIAMPETTFSSGITITVTDTQGGVFSKRTSNTVAVERNFIKPMAALQVQFEATTPSSKQIWYTTTDGNQLSFSDGAFSSPIVKQERVGDKWVITFSDDVTSLNTVGGYYGAFESQDTLSSITLPSSVQSIGTYAFYKCPMLSSVELSEGLTSIGELAFSDCVSIESITLPQSLTELGVGAFYNCDGLTSVTLPENVATIGDSAFNKCDNLVSVYSMATTPPTIGGDVFMRDNVTIYVPDTAYSDYKGDTKWSTYNIYGETYESTDFSANGEVVVLQSATRGNGIDIVLMGDGYSDRHIASGRYEKDIRRAMEHIFSEEPYTTFRDMFNVYMVKCVSTLEGCSDEYAYGSTAFNCKVKSDGMSIDGDNWVAYDYTRSIVGDARLDEAMMVVIMNSNVYAGNCYMASPSVNTTGDFGNGPSLSYFPLCGNDTTFRELILHEACGHGFAKLGDEYSYSGNGQITSYYYYEIKNFEQWGWYKNIDCTLDGALDANSIKWRHLLSDSRYQNDGLGVYEGAYTFASGAYRPTENSIMNDRTGGFNAPSREAIYIRIHKLAYGNSWTYDYEEFVAYDAKNRK